jgi:hypothetical protein
MGRAGEWLWEGDVLLHFGELARADLQQPISKQSNRRYHKHSQRRLIRTTSCACGSHIRCRKAQPVSEPSLKKFTATLSATRDLPNQLGSNSQASYRPPVRNIAHALHTTCISTTDMAARTSIARAGRLLSSQSPRVVYRSTARSAARWQQPIERRAFSISTAGTRPLMRVG